MAVVIGEAAVAIRADASGTAEEIQDEVGPAAEKAGKDAGDVLGSKMALGIAAVGTAVGAGFLSALEQAGLSDKLSAQLGLSADQSAAAGEVAGDLYANAYGDSLEEVNGAVASVIGSIDGMRAASAADLEAVTGSALNFAQAMDVDVAGAATSAGILVKTGLADSAQDAFDLMTVAAQEAGPSMVEPVLEAANEYSTNFAAMGFSGEQAMALLVDASKGGEIALDKAGDAVKEFGIRATDLGDTGAQQALESLGFSGEDMANKLLAGGASAQDAFQQIVGGLQGITDPAAQANAAVALFGTPLEDIGKDKLPAFLDSMSMANGELEGVAGAAERMGDTLSDNAGTNITGFMRSAQQAFVDVIGGQVIPIVSSVVGWLRDEMGPALTTVGGFITDNVVPPLRDLGTWLGENDGLVSALAYTVGTVLVGALSVWAYRSVVSAATNTIAWITTAAASSAGAAAQQKSALQVVAGWVLMAARAVIQGAVIAAVWTAQVVASAVTGAASFLVQVGRVIAGWVLMGAQSLLAAGRVALAWLIAMGPIGLVIAAVIGLVALIVANFDTIVSAISSAWEWVKGAAKAAWDWIVGLIRGAIDLLVSWFMNFTLVGLIIQHWDTIKNATVAAWDAVVGFVTGIPGRLLAGLSALGSMIAGVASSAWQWFYDTVVTKVGALISFVGGIPGRIVSVLSGVGSLLVGLGGDLIRGLVNGISAAAGFVGDVGRNIVNAIIGFVNEQVIGRINNLLEFSVAGITINPPDIPRIPRLHSGGIFDSGSGEGLALLRDQERVVTPEQRVIADRLLGDLLSGSLSAGQAAAVTGGAAQVTQHIYGAEGQSVRELAAVVSRDTVWALGTSATRQVPVAAGGAL